MWHMFFLTISLLFFYLNFASFVFKSLWLKKKNNKIATVFLYFSHRRWHTAHTAISTDLETAAKASFQVEFNS